MSRNIWLATFGVALIAVGACLQFASANESDTVVASEAAAIATAEESAATTAEDKAASTATETKPVELFQAVEEGKADLTFIAKNDHAGRVILTNNTKQPLNLQLPEAFAGVPVLAQFGGGGGAAVVVAVAAVAARPAAASNPPAAASVVAVAVVGKAAVAASSASRPNRPERSTLPCFASTTACAILRRRSRTRWCRPATISTIRP